MNTIGVGLLGTGFAGRAHAHAISSSRRFGKVSPVKVAVFSLNPDKAKTFASTYGFKKWYGDWRELVRDKEVDVVINALPNYMHAEPSMGAAREDKAILCEKPLGRTAEEALKIAESVKETGVTNGVGFNHRWLPAVQLARKLIDKGVVGEIRYFRGYFLEDWAFDPKMPFAWRFDAKDAGYGTVGDNGAHVIDLARFLVGEVERVVAISRIYISERPSSEGVKRVTNDDASAVLLEFENGAIGTLEASRVFPGRTNYMGFEIYGDAGAIFFDLEHLDELRVADYSEDEEVRGVKRIRVLERCHHGVKNYWAKHALGWAESFTLQLEAFLEAVQEHRGYKPDFFDGVAVNAVLDAIKKSSSERRWVEVERLW